jgi:hypothetical protein
MLSVFFALFRIMYFSFVHFLFILFTRFFVCLFYLQARGSPPRPTPRSSSVRTEVTVALPKPVIQTTSLSGPGRDLCLYTQSDIGPGHYDDPLKFVSPRLKMRVRQNVHKPFPSFCTSYCTFWSIFPYFLAVFSHLYHLNTFLQHTDSRLETVTQNPK